MKEIAYVALFFGIIGLLLMILGSIDSSNYRRYDCDDSDWVRSKYGDAYAWEECYEDEAKLYDTGQLKYSIGYGCILFSLVVMIGANKFKK